MVTGKPSKAHGVLEGTRYDGYVYHCPCGLRTTRVGMLRKHVRGDYKRTEQNCPLRGKVGIQ